MNAQNLEIDVISDVVCPWCYIGKRQLEQALEKFKRAHPATQVTVRWQPFQLNPALPVEGVDRSAYLASKFGTARVGEIYQRVKNAGAEVGLDLQIEKIDRQPNTLTVHALISAAQELASQKDAQITIDALQTGATGVAVIDPTEAFFQAYFVQGKDLTQHDVLLDLGQSIGLKAPHVEAILKDESTRQAVADQDLQFREMGVSGVPLFIFNRKLSVNGAQGAAQLFKAMETTL